MATDILGRTLGLYDFVVVETHQNKSTLELGIIVDFTDGLPVVRRFTNDCVLRDRLQSFKNSDERMFLLHQNSVPDKALDVRAELYD